MSKWPGIKPYNPSVDRKVLICDVDGVLAWSTPRIRRWTEYRSGRWETHFNAYSRVEAAKDMPMPFAVQAAMILWRNGWQFPILTSRFWEHAKEGTEEWLLRYCFEYTEVTTVSAALCKYKVLFDMVQKPESTLYVFVDDFMVGQETPFPKFDTGTYNDCLTIPGLHVIPFRNNWPEIVQTLVGEQAGTYPLGL